MTAAGDDPRARFLASLDLPSCRIEFASAPIVLVCGGRVPGLKSNPDDPDPPVASLRHAISKARTQFEIFRPEEIRDWHSDAVFRDLVSFERALASICSLIIIILESPGAMVELGAFSQLPELADKSVTICSNYFVEDASFINLGILRFLAEKESTRVKSYPWDTLRPENINEEVVSDVISDIQGELEKLPATTLLKMDQDSHCMVMISELLRLFVALKEHEIFGYLSQSGFDITAEQLRGRLFLLKSFRIIGTQKYSDATFYISGSEKFHRLRLVGVDKNATVDSLRIETLC